MKTSDFDYKLPKELIAQEPAKKRDYSRLMVLDRKDGKILHKHFYNIVDYLKKGDLLVLNDTKVIPGNIIGHKEDGGAKIEVLLVKKMTEAKSKQAWKCLVRPGKRLKVGSRVIFAKGIMVGTVLVKLETGEQVIEFESKVDFDYLIHKLGNLPLPPYIQSPQPPSTVLGASGVESRYQTVYAQKEGASAAPTAGLHFTPELLENIGAKGVDVAYVTLHTGLATFRPVRTDKIADHQMHTEYYEIPAETFAAIKQAKRVVAVGTTTVRALETARNQEQDFVNQSGETGLFICPGYKFKVVDAMITNFHWPRSTLIMLVSAFVQEGLRKKSIFAGRDLIMKAYRTAVRKKYRFYSFGDAMLIY